MSPRRREAAAWKKSKTPLSRGIAPSLTAREKGEVVRPFGIAELEC